MDDKVYLYSYRYASHMGRKYNLTESKVLSNAKKHYYDAKRNPDFYADLKSEYGGG